MDCKIISRLFFLTIFFISTHVNAIEFKGKFLQGHYIIGITDPSSQIIIDKKKVRYNKSTGKEIQMSRLLEMYKNKIQKDLQVKLKLNNIYEVPKLEKIVLNMGIGEGKEESKLIDKAVEDLSLISGQKAVKTTAKKAIAGFKIRGGMPLGAKVTLRNKIMYEFVYEFCMKNV